MPNSETSNCRERLKKYCVGYGVDLGYGGDPIVPSAITVDMPVPYTKLGDGELNLGGDATNLNWFSDGSLDYVYSSHLLEDFINTKEVLIEWLRVLKPGGNLILYLPNEQRFRAHCKKTGQPYNESHKLSDFGLIYLKEILRDLPVTIVYEKDECEAYSFEIVVRKDKSVGLSVTEKKRVLVWCSSPTIPTGLGRQAKLILGELHKQGKYEIDVVGADYLGGAHQFPYTIYQIHKKEGPIATVQKILMTGKYDILFVYQDMWLSTALGKSMNIIRQELARIGKDIKIICYYTVDGKTYPEWLHLANEADQIVVPNKYGQDVLKKYITSDIKIIPHGIEDVFKPLKESKLKEFRQEYFRENDSKFIVGWIGTPNTRKNIEDALLGFREFLEKHPDSVLYIHGIMDDRMLRCTAELGLSEQVIYPMGYDPFAGFDMEKIKNIIASVDVVLNTSLAEAWGLPMTEAFACGVPVVMPENIAMSKEYEEFTWQIKSGEEQVCFDASGFYHRLDRFDMASKLSRVKTGNTKIKILKARKHMEKYRNVGELWRNTFDELITEYTAKKNTILFAQYESAGDVMLSTSCLKGIKERHKGMSLHYMTRGMYRDILEGNPDIDKIIPWDGNFLRYYEVVYKPHIDKIRTGSWGTGDTPLPNMFAELCGVEIGDASIGCVTPSIEVPKEYLVVHSSGGHAYRIYRYFEQALKGIKTPIIQIGGAGDFRVKNTIDMRGKLTFREVAWVIKNAKLFVGVDSFPHHVSAILGTPQVSLFSTAAPRTTGNPNTKGVLITPEWIKNCPQLGPCHGNADCYKPCIDTIDPNHVRESIYLVLKKESEKT